MEPTFILDCLTHCLYPDRPLPVPSPDLDWERVYALVCQHGLAEMFAVLGRAQPGLWPRDLRERLREDRYRALLYGDGCVRHVQSVLAAFRQVSIPAIVLKGWAAIPTLYGGDYGQRSYVDIDLLVHPKDAARAEQNVLGLGYTARLEAWPGFSRRYGNGRAYHERQQGGSSERAFAVALHWELLDTPYYFRRMPVAALFERAQPLRVAGVNALRLGPEDNLIYACGHVALHHEYDEALLRYYEMAARLLRAGPAFDWAAVLARSQAWRVVLPVQRVTAHLDALWPGIVPARASAEIHALQDTHGERVVHQWVVRYRGNHTVHAFLVWLTMRGMGRRGRYLVEQAFPGPAYLRQRYGPAPGGVWPLLYFRRMALAAQYAASARRQRK